MKLLRALLQEVNSGYQINRWVTVEVIRLEMIQCFKSKGEPSEDLRVMIRKQFAESYLDSIPTNWIELACSTIGRVDTENVEADSAPLYIRELSVKLSVKP